MTSYIPTLLCDFYKISHREQYPQGTEVVYSTWTPRSSRIPEIDHVVNFGLQGFIEEWLIGYFGTNFFARSVEDVVAEYTRYIRHTLGVSDPQDQHIRDLHALGYLPLLIKALPEGTEVPIRVPMFTIQNTKKKFFWLTNYLETLISTELWQSMTSATIAKRYRRILDRYADETGGDLGFVPFQGHDFSMRGMSSIASGARSAAGHLLSFVGTDTITGIQYLEKYYDADIEKELVGCSIPATEHSVMCAHGQDELSCYRRLITEVYPKGFISIVSDTWDLWKVLSDAIAPLKNTILSRDGKVVIRPDCYADDTMILTQDGWKLFKDLDENNDLVAQVHENGMREFVKPIRYIKQNYTGEMISFSDGKGKLDLLVTPNHRMVFYQNHKIKIQEAKDARVGFWEKDIIRSAEMPSRGISLSPLERLKIAFQADGSYLTRGHGIRFSFSKQRKIDRLKDILALVGVKYKIYNLSDGKFEFNVHIDESIMQKNFGWVTTSDLCGNWSREFIEELSYWDATRRSEHRFKFDTTNPGVMADVELIALAAGYGIYITSREDNRKDCFSDVYTAHILKSNKLGGQSVHKKTVDYDGVVYSVQVPTGMLLVKRNGGSLVSGNSGDPVKIVCGDASNKTDAARKGVIEILWDIFGGTTNLKGFKQLDPHIGAIYGDAISLERVEKICSRLKAKGFASTNMVYGIGSLT